MGHRWRPPEVAPTIDGVVDAREWAGAVPLTGFTGVNTQELSSISPRCAWHAMRHTCTWRFTCRSQGPVARRQRPAARWRRVGRRLGGGLSRSGATATRSTSSSLATPLARAWTRAAGIAPGMGLALPGTRGQGQLERRARQSRLPRSRRARPRENAVWGFNVCANIRGLGSITWSPVLRSFHEPARFAGTCASPPRSRQASKRLPG